jgi:hypothetical protein
VLHRLAVDLTILISALFVAFSVCDEDKDYNSSTVVVKCYVPSKKCLLDAVCCVLCVLFLNALQTSLYYYSAPCPSVFQHIPEMLYYIPLLLIGKRSLLFISGA